MARKSAHSARVNRLSVRVRNVCLPYAFFIVLPNGKRSKALERARKVVSVIKVVSGLHPIFAQKVVSVKDRSGIG